jgi:Uma2 family endonuclease
MVAKTVTADRFTVEDYRQVSEMLESAGMPVMLEEGRLVKRVSTKDWHSGLAGTFRTFIESHLLTHDLPGIITGETTGYQAADDDCPEPDVAYCSVLSHYIDEPCIPPEYPPALVIEVVSDPKNKRELDRLARKRAKYMVMGATLWEVWALDRAVHIYTPGQAMPTIEREKLTYAGLPGLEIPLKTVFAKLNPADPDAADNNS